ncbi:LysR family transcriptional regulator [Pasteurellaceae bacterium LIM206]|nr:LysR family transcriptional regulator [Pasteurellaceae bacterium LIM206]
MEIKISEIKIMLDKLYALKVFCITAETMQFKETANRLAVSPPVVTRIIAELETELGEPLFVRNTRQIKLTTFGETFVEKARYFLAEGEKLFNKQTLPQDEMKGPVRIAMPETPFNMLILRELLVSLKSYPDIVLDWQAGEKRLNVVDAQIDLGVRVGFPADSRLIVQKVGRVSERIVAAPELLDGLPTPRHWQDLARDYPLTAVKDENTGRFWAWQINENAQFFPQKPAFIADDMYAGLYAALAGKTISHCLDWLCRPYLQSGELVELFADMPKTAWTVYLYRSQSTVVPARIRFVFDEMKRILTTYFSEQTPDVNR